MQITDVIADMLTRIRNANDAKHQSVDIPASGMKKAIAEILNEEGYIKNYEVIEENAEGAAYTPPTPQEMRARIDEARIVTKEMKAQARKDARMAKLAAKQQAAAEAAEAESEESADEE